MTESEISTTTARSSSFVRELPVATADPETSRIGSILFEATDVQSVLEEEVESSKRTNEEVSHPLEEQAVEERPLVISIRINKSTSDVRLGVVFESVDGKLQVGKVSPNGVLRDSALRTGDRVIALDHHRSCIHWTSAKAAAYIREKVGLLSLVVKTPCGNPSLAQAIVYKESPTDRIGVRFQNNEAVLRIRNVSPGGLLGDMCVLNEGDYVDSINDVSVRELDPSLAAQIIRLAPSVVSILVKNSDTTEVSIQDMNTKWSTRTISLDQDGDIPVAMANEVGTVDLEAGSSEFEFQANPAFISVKVFKASEATKLGVKLVNPDGETLQIAQIQLDGLLATSPLKPGFHLWSIDNYRCSTWKTNQALEYLKSTVGSVLLVAQDLNGDPREKLAMAYKPSPRAKLGVSFVTAGGTLRVGSIVGDGVFGSSILNENDEIISINNIRCQVATPAEAARITQSIPETVVILAKSSLHSGVVLSHLAHGQLEGPSLTTTGQPHARTESEQKGSFAIGCFLVILMIIIIAALSQGQSDNGY